MSVIVSTRGFLVLVAIVRIVLLAQGRTFFFWSKRK